MGEINHSSTFTQVQFVLKKEGEGINEGIKLLYTLIQNSPNKRTTFYAEDLNTSNKNIEKWIKQLREESKIEFKGSKKIGVFCKVKLFGRI